MVPLECRWFNLNQEKDEMHEIMGINGAFYQPCAEDVNYLI